MGAQRDREWTREREAEIMGESNRKADRSVQESRTPERSGREEGTHKLTERVRFLREYLNWT